MLTAAIVWPLAHPCFLPQHVTRRFRLEGCCFLKWPSQKAAGLVTDLTGTASCCVWCAGVSLLRLPRLYSFHLKCTVLESDSGFELKDLLSVAKEVYLTSISVKLKLETTCHFMGLQADGAVSLNVLQQSFVGDRGPP